MDLIEALNWRYATKRMTGVKVPQEKIERILDAISLSASSIGLQPYTIFVTENTELKEKIYPIANNQPQILECSHLLIFASWDNLTDERIDASMNRIVEVRGALNDRMKNHRIGLKRRVAENTAEKNFNWIARQAYLALGTALIAAANEAVDTTPMEGFDAGQLDTLLQLKEKGLRSVLLLPLGYRESKTDFLYGLAKVRREKEKLFVRI